MRSQVYDKCEALFVAAEFMVAQGDPARAAMAQRIADRTLACQNEGDCPLVAICTARFNAGTLDRLRTLLAAPVVRLADYRAARRIGERGPCVLADNAALTSGITDEHGNAVVRQRHDRATLARRETGMNRLAEYWEGLAVAGPPPLNTFNPLELETFGLVGRASLIDVSADDPAHYRILFQGSRRTIDRAADYRGMRIADYEVPLFAGAVLRDYLTVKMTGQMAYDQLVIYLPKTQLAYTRLLLPFSSGGNRVTHIVVAFRTQPFDVAGHASEHLFPVHET